MIVLCQILSKDSVTVAVDAVVYYRVSNATVSVTNVEDAHRSTRLLAQTTLRNVLGTKNLSEILSDRENISHFMQVYTAIPVPVYILLNPETGPQALPTLLLLLDSTDAIKLCIYIEDDILHNRTVTDFQVKS